MRHSVGDEECYLDELEKISLLQKEEPVLYLTTHVGSHLLAGYNQLLSNQLNGRVLKNQRDQVVSLVNLSKDLVSQ